jgi:hypothetical protein
MRQTSPENPTPVTRRAFSGQYKLKREDEKNNKIIWLKQKLDRGEISR